MFLYYKHRRARLPFCTKSGARMGDDAKWSLYKHLNGGKVEKIETPEESEESEEPTKVGCIR
jgi:hypothetical protein